jgi:hypothetical protein
MSSKLCTRGVVQNFLARSSLLIGGASLELQRGSVNDILSDFLVDECEKKNSKANGQ